MIVPTHFAGKTLAVFGLARSGLSAVAALRAADAHVLAWDDAPAARAQAATLGAELTPLDKMDWQNVAALVLAPGVPLRFPAPNPWVVAARAAGVDIIGDIELFAQARATLPAHKVIGITGTNGKSTTTALITHLLRSVDTPALMGGNIGQPILSENALPAGGVYVLELSSYQIDLLQTLACDVAVLTNITPDHLDRHGDMAGYVAAKERLFGMRNADGVAVIGIDDALSADVFARAAAPKIAISKDSVVGRQSAWPALQGIHNAQNVAAAVAACTAVGVSSAALERGLQSFSGLAHRMERIGEKHGVQYVNDSKATNPDSAAPALTAFSNIHWIAGGRRKSDELDACLPHLKNVRAAYLIGEAADMFARILKPHTQVHTCGTLANAVARAAAAAEPGDVVLLSPACASQDQFTDFEARGAAFRASVEAIT